MGLRAAPIGPGESTPADRAAAPSDGSAGARRRRGQRTWNRARNRTTTCFVSWIWMKQLAWRLAVWVQQSMTNHIVTQQAMTHAIARVTVVFPFATRGGIVSRREAGCAILDCGDRTRTRTLLLARAQMNRCRSSCGTSTWSSTLCCSVPQRNLSNSYATIT